MPFLVVGLIVAGLIIGLMNILVTVMGIDPSSSIGMPWEGAVDRLVYELTSPTAKAAGVLSIMVGGMAYMFGAVDLPSFGKADPVPPKPAAPQQAISLSPDADAASRRVRTALLRLSNMQPDVMTPEIEVEYEAIRSRHVPDLQAAHAKARRAVADENDIAALDTEYAASLTLIANKLNGLLDDCEVIAGRDLAVQSRFIETRHPPENDGLL